MVNNTNNNNKKYEDRKTRLSEQPQQRVYTYAVYPDYWAKTWGEAPILGYVKETNEYWAKYQAYDKKLLPYNATFGPRCVLITDIVKPTPHPTTTTKKPYNKNRNVK